VRRLLLDSRNRVTLEGLSKTVAGIHRRPKEYDVMNRPRKEFRQGFLRPWLTAYSRTILPRPLVFGRAIV
jgi:hypothetical protein